MKKKILIILALLMAFAAGSVLAIENNNTEKLERIQVALDKAMIVRHLGQEVQLLDGNGNKSYPIIYKGKVYLPVSDIGNILNAAVTWDKKTNTLDIGGNATSTLGGIMETLTFPPEDLPSAVVGNMTALVLGVDKGKDGTILRALSYAQNEKELTVNVGGRQKYLIGYFGNQSGLAYHVTISDMDTGEIVRELDSPKREGGQYQFAAIPVENVSRIKITGELKEETP